MKKPDKLVRDRIPEIIEADGRKTVTHIADDDEYFARLKDKLVEEVDEFLENPIEKELADILEVVYAIRDFKKIDASHLEKVRLEKNEKNGGFAKRIVLDKTE